MYTTNKTTKSIADAALKVMMGEAQSPAQQAAIAIAMKEKGQKPKDEMKEAKLHPNQQKLDVHEPEKDELTAKDFEMLRKGKKAPTNIKEEDAYSKDRYAVKNGKAVKDNPSHMGSDNYKDQPHHVWATSAEEALKKKKVNEATVLGEILKKIDEMKGPWPGTPEYNKKFPPKEMKTGQEKATKTGVIKKTIKGIVHTAKPMKEEVEHNQDEVKVLAKEDVSFQSLLNLYMDNGVESLLKTVEKIKEEASNDEFHKEVEEHKKKAEGKVDQPEVAKGAVKAVAVTKEEAELEEAAKWRSTSVAKKVTDPDDYSDSVSYDYHHDNPKSTGIKKATSDTPTKYGSLSARPHAQVASQGARKGMITKQHAERLKSRIKAGMNNEEVEQIDELNKSTLASYVKKASHDVAHKGALTRQYSIDSNAAKKSEDYLQARKSDEKANKMFDKSWNRRKNMAKAVDRLAKEEVEQIEEREMTDAEMKKREEIVKGMKKGLAGFKERYGERAKSVMYATATKQAMKD